MTDLDVIQRDIKYMRGEFDTLKNDIKQEMRSIYKKLEYENLTKTYATNDDVKNVKDQVVKLENNQRYVVYTVLTVVIVGTIKLIQITT
jgi:polyhydroxyalkanoate synthesis regulator phasin